MQLTACPRRGHVQEPRTLEPRARAPQPLDVARQRAFAATASDADRREQQLGVGCCSRQLQPVEERLAIAALHAADARHDHDVPLEPLGAVHGKNFHRTARRCRRRVQFGGKIVEGIARQRLGVRLRRECLNEFLRVEQVARFAAGGRATEPQPGAVDTLPQGQRTFSPEERGRQRGADARQPRDGVGIEQPRARRIAAQFPDGCTLPLAQLLQLRKGKPAAGRVQQRQPGAAIAQVLDGARECAQVARHGALAERFEPHAADRDARRLQGQGDRHRVMARAHQHGNAHARIARAALAHQCADLRRLLLRRLAGYRVHLHAAPQLTACRQRAQIADRRQARIVVRRKHFHAEAIHPIDERRRRAEIAAQLQCREPQCADAGRARAQEQADLGFAELVDRLHRIAHRKQRTAIARFPARRERAEQFKLVEGRILEFIDQHVTKRVSAAQRQVGRLPLLGQPGARRSGDRREINAPLVRELELQFGRRVPQQQRQRRERRRVRRSNHGVGERKHFVDQDERARN